MLLTILVLTLDLPGESKSTFRFLSETPLTVSGVDRGDRLLVILRLVGYSSNPNGPWVAMKASSALWSQPAPCGGLELQRRACLLTERYACAIGAHGVACCTP